MSLNVIVRLLYASILKRNIISCVIWERRFNSLPESSAGFYSNNNENSLPHLIFLHLIP